MSSDRLPITPAIPGMVHFDRGVNGTFNVEPMPSPKYIQRLTALLIYLETIYWEVLNVP
jgi:hypothetical protein